MAKVIKAKIEMAQLPPESCDITQAWVWIAAHRRWQMVNYAEAAKADPENTRMVTFTLE